MYRQQQNWEFVLETLTIQGGLLILLSHFMLLRPDAKQPLLGGSKVDNPIHKRANQLQAFGRMLIVAIFLYYAFQKVHTYTQRMHHFGLSNQQAETAWGTIMIEGIVIVVLLYMCSLVIIGMKSRWCALALALMMFVTACYFHPFWIYMISSKETYDLEGVAGMEGYTVDAFTMADHQRYFFFQTMSTVGALLLLVVHGPGNLSVDEHNGPMQLPTAKGDA